MKRLKDLGFYIFELWHAALKHAMVLTHRQQLEGFVLKKCAHTTTLIRVCLIHLTIIHASSSSYWMYNLHYSRDQEAV